MFAHLRALSLPMSSSLVASWVRGRRRWIRGRWGLDGAGLAAVLVDDRYEIVVFVDGLVLHASGRGNAGASDRSRAF
jgi:hypothetical protein